MEGFFSMLSVYLGKKTKYLKLCNEDMPWEYDSKFIGSTSGT